MYIFGASAFVVEDFVKFFKGKGVAMAGETQVELEIKDWKGGSTKNGYQKNREWLNGAHRRSHVKKFGKIENEKFKLSEVERIVNEKEFDYKPSEVNICYQKMGENVRKWVYRIFTSPLLVVEAYKREIGGSVADKDKERIAEMFREAPSNMSDAQRTDVATELLEDHVTWNGHLDKIDDAEDDAEDDAGGLQFDEIVDDEDLDAAMNRMIYDLCN